MIHAGKTKPIVPIGPGTLAKLSRFGMNKHCAQRVVSNQCCERMNIGIVPDIHDLRYHALGHGDGLIGCLPPDVFTGEMFQCVLVYLTHGNHSNSIQQCDITPKRAARQQKLQVSIRA